jgi:hypothetical protein
MKVTPAKRKRAKEYWLSGEFLQAGKLIFEDLPKNVRPLWATSMLDHCRKRFPQVREVDEVYLLAHDPAHWEQARSAFDAVRALALAPDKPFPGADLLYRVAENTAKVIYNCSGGGAPYDHNAGWKLVAALHAVCEFIGDSRFTKEASEIALVAGPEE